MKITLRAWIIFIILALLGIAIWYKLSFPEFSFVDLSVDKKTAFKKAEKFLADRGVDTSLYRKAVIFVADFDADRFLQRALGFKGEEEFVREHNYNLFSWAVRFYQENKKEEYQLSISSKTGEVVFFRHEIEDTEIRHALDKEAAKEMVKDFLAKTYNINFAEFDFHQEQVKKYDRRIDYGFSWEKKNIYIPWDKSGDFGGAKLLIGALISGKEIKEFSYLNLDIPEKFTRLIQNQMATGRLLTSIAMFIYLMWVAFAIIILVKRRHDFLARLTKRFFIFVGLSIAVLTLLATFNDFQEVLFSYNTTSLFSVYIGYFLIGSIVTVIFESVTVMIPGISGEFLRYDSLPKHRTSSFFHYINSTFFSRRVSELILLGYLVFLIVLGLQSLMFYLGHKFLGVWVEHNRLTELSTSYLPFLGALIIGYKASMSEEIVFRVFGMSWAKKYLKSSVIAAIVVSLIWGFGHSQYAIFPTWFRGIEVGVMGLVFAFVFLRYGIICLIAAHYLFDVFWGVVPYLIGKSNAYLFGSSVFILSLPLIFAVIAYFKNLPDKEREIKSVLSKQQIYNLKILHIFISERLKQGVALDYLKNELISNGWDKVLIDLAIEEK